MRAPIPHRTGPRVRAWVTIVCGLVLATLTPNGSNAQSSEPAPVEAPSPAPARPVERPAAVPAPLKGVVRELRSGPLLMHGNYCGIGNRPGAAPIDALDAACMRHDACTKTGKLPGCACNERLRVEAATIADSPRTPPDIKLVASATASAMAVLICKTGGTVAVPIPLPR